MQTAWVTIPRMHLCDLVEVWVLNMKFEGFLQRYRTLSKRQWDNQCTKGSSSWASLEIHSIKEDWARFRLHIRSSTSSLSCYRTKALLSIQSILDQAKTRKIGRHSKICRELKIIRWTRAFQSMKILLFARECKSATNQPQKFPKMHWALNLSSSRTR